MSDNENRSATPPPLPAPGGEPAPKRGGLPRWALVLIIVAGGMLALSIVAGLIGTVAIIVPQMQEKQRRLACANTLSQFGTMYVVATAQESAFPPPPPGPQGCSYVTRDFANFPIDSRATEPQVIGACVGPAGAHTHKGGTVVAYDTGSVTFLTDAELGLSADDPLTVGPGAKSPILRVLAPPGGGGN